MPEQHSPADFLVLDPLNSVSAFISIVGRAASSVAVKCAALRSVGDHRPQFSPAAPSASIIQNTGDNTMKTEKRFDQKIQRQLDDSPLLFRHATKGAKEVKLARSTAYRMAKNYSDMQLSDHNELLQFVTSIKKYAKSKDPIGDWLQDDFASLAMIGEDVHGLLKAIDQGMTLRQYLAETPALFLNDQKRSRAKAVASESVFRGPIPERASVEDRLRYWKDRAKKAEALQQADHQRIALLERMVKKLRSLIEKVPA